MNSRQGYYRIPGHLIIWASAVCAPAYFLYLWGQPFFTLREQLLVAGLSIIAFYHSEMRQWTERRETAGKMLLDWLSKSAGVALGVILANWWWL